MNKKNLTLILLLIIGNELFSQFVEIIQNSKKTINKGVPKKITPKSNSLKDSDGDGISDNIDKCPYLKGDLKNKGCPKTVKKVKPKDNIDKKPKIIEKEAINELN